MKSLKSRLKPFLPPIAAQLYRRLNAPVVSFSGDYGSWEEAAAHALGYHSAEILDRVAAATRKVVAGEVAYERDSVLFERVEYSWPLLASLLQVGLECGSLRVIDFGGSLGSTWRQNKKYLDRLSRLPRAWHVVEQEQFVSIGRTEFATAELHFDHTMAEAAAGGVDVVLFLGSLCYVSDPGRFLQEAAATGARYLIIDRLPVICGSRDRIALQKVTEPIYPASYPIRIFAEEQLFSELLREWRLIERWDCDLQPDADSRYYGFFMEKR